MYCTYHRSLKRPLGPLERNGDADAIGHVDLDYVCVCVTDRSSKVKSIVMTSWDHRR